MIILSPLHHQKHTYISFFLRAMLLILEKQTNKPLKNKIDKTKKKKTENHK